MNSDMCEQILGYPVSTLGREEAVATIVRWLESGERNRLFCCANPHSLVTADADPAFRAALCSADLLTPDGAGIVLASRILRGKIRQRVTGSDIFHGLSATLNRDYPGQYSCFFLGASEATLSTICSRFRTDYPQVRIAGSYSPPYKDDFSAGDDQEMVAAVKAARPDLVWVAMTAPKQEKWISRNRELLDVGFIGAIGAVFDFYAGNVKRSHPLFQRFGLEWLPRLLREPRRLWRRNFVSSPIFLLRICTQKLRG